MWSCGHIELLFWEEGPPSNVYLHCLLTLLAVLHNPQVFGQRLLIVPGQFGRNSSLQPNSRLMAGHHTRYRSRQSNNLDLEILLTTFWSKCDTPVHVGDAWAIGKIFFVKKCLKLLQLQKWFSEIKQCSIILCHMDIITIAVRFGKKTKKLIN